MEVFMSTRLVVVMRDGLIEDVYSDRESDIELVVVDHDADEFADDEDEEDDRVSLVDGERAWVTSYSVVADVWFVSRVFQAWE